VLEDTGEQHRVAGPWETQKWSRSLWECYGEGTVTLARASGLQGEAPESIEDRGQGGRTSTRSHGPGALAKLPRGLRGPRPVL
jgi:hypothetical protein